MSDSKVLYRGPSMLDGQPIVAIAVPKSTNSKTGPVINVHIVRADMSPVEAMRTGADSSICGQCPLRGVLRPDGSREGRGCYVVYAQGPQSAWRANADKPVITGMDRLRFLWGADIRMGAYGDPAALPAGVVQGIRQCAGKWLCYTHQWANESLMLEAWRVMSMASVDSVEEHRAAEAAGWRTFRYGDHSTRTSREIVCPNESRGVQCIDCGLCDGLPDERRSVKSILITPHGSGAKYAR